MLITLRDKIVSRDSNRCRNCGSSKILSVHHWLPTHEHCGEVNEWGYKDGQCPLVVPEAGLVTLCKQCHDALTAARKITLGQKQLRRIQMKLSTYNIFQLWAMNEKNLPLKVIKKTWNGNLDQYYLVDEIQIRKWTRGSAWGSYYREGVIKDRDEIVGASSFQWCIKE
jgi:hypothetical protein